MGQDGNYNGGGAVRREWKLEIGTPEGIEFSLPLAGPVTRFLAWAVDAACIVGLSFTILVVASFLMAISFDFALALMTLLLFAVTTGYFIFLEWVWQGQTIGKRMLGLRVMDAQGLRLTFSQIVVRNLLRAIDSLPFFYMLGGLFCLATRYAQRLGDLAANTIVVRPRRHAAPDLSQVLSDKYNSFRQHPHLAGRLRQRVSPREAGLALQALMRRENLAPQARVQLFEEIADYFREVAPFPESATEGLSDEQYVRNVVDIMYRRRGE